jgi:hypothetical protein
MNSQKNIVFGIFVLITVLIFYHYFSGKNVIEGHGGGGGGHGGGGHGGHGGGRGGYYGGSGGGIGYLPGGAVSISPLWQDYWGRYYDYPYYNYYPNYWWPYFTNRPYLMYA